MTAFGQCERLTRKHLRCSSTACCVLGGAQRCGIHARQWVRQQAAAALTAARAADKDRALTIGEVTVRVFPGDEVTDVLARIRSAKLEKARGL